jgi:hypothetical protein
MLSLVASPMVSGLLTAPVPMMQTTARAVTPKMAFIDSL